MSRGETQKSSFVKPATTSRQDNAMQPYQTSDSKIHTKSIRSKTRNFDKCFFWEIL